MMMMMMMNFSPCFQTEYGQHDMARGLQSLSFDCIPLEVFLGGYINIDNYMYSTYLTHPHIYILTPCVSCLSEGKNRTASSGNLPLGMGGF